MSKQIFPQWTSLAGLMAYLAAAPGNLARPLHQVGAAGDDSAIIGHWAYDGTRSRPLGRLDLTAAAWPHAVVTSGSGLTRTITNGTPALPATGGTVRCIDRAGPTFRGDFAYTLVGSTVTLSSDPGVTTEMHLVIGGRTGALDIAAAGEIIPLAGARVLLTSTGLKLLVPTSTESGCRLPMLSSAMAWTQMIGFSSEWTAVIDGAATNGIECGTGLCGSDPTLNLVGGVSRSTTYKSYAGRGSLAGLGAVALGTEALASLAACDGGYITCTPRVALDTLFYAGSGLTTPVIYGSGGVQDPAVIFPDLLGYCVHANCPAVLTSVEITVTSFNSVYQ